MIQLAELVAPPHTAVLTMEMQRGVVGDGGILPALADAAAEANLLPNVGRVCRLARDAGARVVHCTAEMRPDGVGFAANCRIFALTEKMRAQVGHGGTDIGTPGVELVPEVELDARDVVVPRMHGMTPFTSTALDQILRNTGIRTVIATGVSVNLGILGMSLSALDLGYQVVVVRDAVVGVPREYAEAVIANSLSMIATIVTIDELADAWSSPLT